MQLMSTEIVNCADVTNRRRSCEIKVIRDALNKCEIGQGVVIDLPRKTVAGLLRIAIAIRLQRHGERIVIRKTKDGKAYVGVEACT